jgi:thiamine monophosphate synthase
LTIKLRKGSVRNDNIQSDSIQTKEVSMISKQNKVKLIIHFYSEVAEKLNCESIHLPLFKLKENYEKLSKFKTIGTSVHSVEEAIEAQKLGAIYISAGHIFATDCKKDLPPRGLEFLKN